jgi:hypothetical protein
MTVGLDRAFEPPPAVSEDGRTGLRAILVDIFIRPAAAMRHLAERQGRIWIWPLLVLALLASVTAAVQTRSAAAETMANLTVTEPGAAGAGSPAVVVEGDTISTDAQTAQVMQTASTVGVVISAVFVFVAAIIGVALVAAILHFLGTVFGGQQSFGETLTVASWAQVPVILGLALRLVAGLIWGFDTSPEGLSGLVEPSSYLHPLLGQVELWHLWGLALLFIGMRAVARIPRVKAAVAVGVIVALQILVGEIGVTATRYFGGGS